MKKKETQKTLRDEIAIAAMAALILQTNSDGLSMHTEEGTLIIPKRKGVPRLAYLYADEMLRIRESA